MPAQRSSAKPPKPAEAKGDLAALGFQVANSGPHTRKTLMLQELEALLAAVPAEPLVKAYWAPIVEENVLGKGTLSTRKEAASRLTALHGLDHTKSLFRMRRRMLDVGQIADPPAGVAQRPDMQAQSACTRLNCLRASSTICATHPSLSQQQRESSRVWDLPPASAVNPTSEEEG